MSDEFDSANQSDGGGLRRQLEEALQKQKELEQSLPDRLKEAEERGAQQAKRRFDALEVFGPERPGLAEAWVEKNPEGELSLDVAKEFASKFGVTLGEATTEPTPEPVAPEVKQAAEQFQKDAPLVPGAQQTYTPEDIRRIGIQNEAEALRLIAEGAMKTD